MRISILFTVLLLFSFLKTNAQCDLVNGLQIIDAPNISITANAECTDADGWTHYYNSDNGFLILSINKNGQNIGDLNAGLAVSSLTRPDYGNVGFNLSHADYINFDIWMVSNRSWQISGATSVNNPIQIRSYFNQTDTSDINKLKTNLGIFFPYDIIEKTAIFNIGDGNGLDAYSTVTQPVNAVFGLYNTTSAPPASYGVHNGYFYGEYEVYSTDIAGGTGLLIFTSNPPVAIAGKVAKPNGIPVPNVNLSVPGGSTVMSSQSGIYSMPDLNIGLDYELIPEKNTGHGEDISVADLIYLSRHLSGLQDFSTPFQYIAADVDNNTIITQNDVEEILDLLLGETIEFNNNTSWRFVPQSYNFPNQNDPFTPPFPESLKYTDLMDSLFNENFTGIKIGDIGDGMPDSTPALNTIFVLPEVNTCSPGEEIVFELTANDFQGLRGFQFTLEWDKDVMSFIGIDNYNLMGLDAQSIGTNSASDGLLTFAWFNPFQMGTSLSDGSTICELRFVVTGNINDTTPLSFTNTGITDVLIVHQNLTEKVPAFINGNTTVGNNATIGANAIIEPADCDGTPTGSIDLSVSGVVQPVAYEWSNGAATEDIDMLIVGTYTVTVTDASGGCPKVVSFDIPVGGEFEVEAEVTSMTCPTVLDGSIDLNISGGSPPFIYQWSNGNDTEIIDGLYQGMYYVTVTDAAGCTQDAAYEIENPNRIFPVVMVMNSNNPGTSNGSIMIQNIIGGFPPFTFSWSNGADTQSIMDVPLGHYAVTITDEMGCGHVFGYLIHDLMVSTKEMDDIEFKMGVFPNPMNANTHYTLMIDSPIKTDIEAFVYSPNGQLISQNNLPVQEGLNHFSLLSPNTSSLYFIKIIYKNETAGWLKMVVR